MIFIIKGLRTIVFIFILNNNKDEDNSPKTLNDKITKLMFTIKITIWEKKVETQSRKYINHCHASISLWFLSSQEHKKRFELSNSKSIVEKEKQ